MIQPKQAAQNRSPWENRLLCPPCKNPHGKPTNLRSHPGISCGVIKEPIGASQAAAALECGGSPPHSVAGLPASFRSCLALAGSLAKKRWQATAIETYP